MKKLIRAVAAVSAAGAAFALAPAANASSYIAGCQLNGNAKFDGSGLQGPPSYGPISYSFDGSLSGCQSSNGGPASGTVFAGEQGLSHPTGDGSCASSDSRGEAVVRWADGNHTVIDYKTTGVTAAVGMTGSVVPATSETTIGASGNTVPLFTTTEPSTPVGSNMGGALAFQVPDPTECLSYVEGTTTAVTSAGITGTIGDGQGPVPLPALPAPPPLPQPPPPPIDIGPLQ
jgi:hypothetical protein